MSGELVALLLHHRGRGLVDEGGVDQLGLGARHVLGETCNLLVQALQFRVLVDQPCHGDQDFHLTDQGDGRLRGGRLVLQHRDGVGAGEEVQIGAGGGEPTAVLL